jgi:uncharacterized protein YegL
MAMSKTVDPVAKIEVDEYDPVAAKVAVNVACVLDQSGSMGVVVDDTIKGFNKFLRDQVEADPDSLFTLTLFSTQFDLRHDNVRIADVPFLDRASYRPNGQTALYDAVCTTIKRMEEVRQGDARIVVVILTDGEENASRRYTYDQVTDLIKAKTDEGWEFIYLAASLSGVQAGRSLGFQQDRVYSYDQGQTQSTFGAISSGLRTYRSNGKSAVLTSNLAANLPTKDDEQ